MAPRNHLFTFVTFVHYISLLPMSKTYSLLSIVIVYHNCPCLLFTIDVSLPISTFCLCPSFTIAIYFCHLTFLLTSIMKYYWEIYSAFHMKTLYSSIYIELELPLSRSESRTACICSPGSVNRLYTFRFPLINKCIIN